jgi:hypothetical protein
VSERRAETPEVEIGSIWGDTYTQTLEHADGRLAHDIPLNVERLQVGRIQEDFRKCLGRIVVGETSVCEVQVYDWHRAAEKVFSVAFKKTKRGESKIRKLSQRKTMCNSLTGFL